MRFSQPTNIEDKRAGNWAKVKGGTRAETSPTRSGTFAVNRSCRSIFTRAARGSGQRGATQDIRIVSSPALARFPRFYSSWSFSRKLLPGERPTRPHAAPLVFRCLHLSKDPNWSSCVHWPLVTAVICAALHPVRRASCTSTILSMYWTCFSFRCAQRIRKKLAQLRRGGPQSQCKSRATFPISTSSKSRPETSSPRFNSTCLFLVGGSGTHRKHPEASQQPEMVEFLPPLQLQRWTASARDVRVDFFFFEKITFCRIPDGKRNTRPFVGRFPLCVVQDRTPRKVVVSVSPTDVLVTCAR